MRSGEREWVVLDVLHREALDDVLALWRLDQLADGTYRIMPKAVPNSRDTLALSAVGSSAATLATFKPDSDRQRWVLKTP